MMIKSTNLANARLMDFYQVMNLTALYLDKEDITGLQLADVVAAFKMAFSDLDKAVKQGQKTGFTAELITLDDSRDNIFTGFNGALDNMTRFPDKEIVQSAAKLQIITEKYGKGITRLPQREESAVLTSIVAELRNSDNMALLQKTGLTLWVDKLAEANTEFDLLYASRTEKEAEFITGLTRTERANTQAAFEKLTRAIEAYAYINGEANYKALAEKINTEVANVKQASKARATMNKKNEKTA